MDTMPVADLLVLASTVHTMDPAGPPVTALALRDGVIAAVAAPDGVRDLLDTWRGPDTVVALARFAATTRWTDVPEHVRKKVLLHTLDVLAVAAAGSARWWNALVKEHTLAEAPAGPCTVIGSPQGCTAQCAAQVNATAAHGIELDDFHVPAAVHAGCVVVPTALALAEAEGLSSTQPVTAVAVGFETVIRLGLAFSPQLTTDRGSSAPTSRSRSARSDGATTSPIMRSSQPVGGWTRRCATWHARCRSRSAPRRTPRSARRRRPPSWSSAATATASAITKAPGTPAEPLGWTEVLEKARGLADPHLGVGGIDRIAEELCSWAHAERPVVGLLRKPTAPAPTACGSEAR